VGTGRLSSSKKGEEKMLTTTSVSSLMKNEVVSADSNETLSKIISRMASRSLHEIVVVDDKNRLLGYFGLDLLTKKKHAPLNTKIERLMVTPPKIDAEKSIFDAVEIMLETGFRALPVVNGLGHLKGIISRTDIIQIVPKLKGIGNVLARDMMTPEPKLLSLSDSLDSALSLMLELDEFCAPAIDKSGRIAGGVLIDAITKGMWRTEDGLDVGDIVGENNKLKIEVRSFVSPVAVVKGGDNLEKVCEEMGKFNPYLCVVADDSNLPVGVITQYDVLNKLKMSIPEKALQVDITGLEIKDPFVYSSLRSKIERFVKKIGGFSWLTLFSFNIHVVTHKRGGRNKWSVRAKLATDKGLFSVKSSGWDLLKCVDEIVEELWRKIIALKK
jgi:CBS domain-containing protein